MAARRQSIMQSDLPSGSPHPRDDRRKSLFPLVPTRRRSSVAGIAGVLAAKKFRKFGRLGDIEGSPQPVQINHEPTYRMEPKTKFGVGAVHKVLKEILNDRLNDFQYNSKFCSTMTQVLTDEIKERLKQMSWERYKLVVMVTMGERKDQDVMVTSRCSWDAKVDSFATYTFTNRTLFCTASAYGLYAE